MQSEQLNINEPTQGERRVLERYQHRRIIFFSLAWLSSLIMLAIALPLDLFDDEDASVLGVIPWALLMIFASLPRPCPRCKKRDWSAFGGSRRSKVSALMLIVDGPRSCPFCHISFRKENQLVD